jgi:hypothetical protein
MAYDYVKEWAKYLRSEWGLDSDFSIPAAKVYLYLYIYRCNPVITSGFRSIEKQAQLVEDYKKGVPGILTPNPPGKSLHNRKDWLGKPASWAIDIDHNNNEIANLIAKHLGLFWAGPKDWVHFAVRGGYL